MSELDRFPEQGPEELTQSQEIARILSGIGEDFGFDPETVAEIAGQSDEESFETAYSYLTQAGPDPDEVLRSLIERTEDLEQ